MHASLCACKHTYLRKHMYAWISTYKGCMHEAFYLKLLIACNSTSVVIATTSGRCAVFAYLDIFNHTLRIEFDRNFIILSWIFH